MARIVHSNADAKSCPLCGARPDVGEFDDSDETGERYGYVYVECPSRATHFAGVHADDLNTALDIWNRRP